MAVTTKNNNNITTRWPAGCSTQGVLHPVWQLSLGLAGGRSRGNARLERSSGV